LLAGFMLSFLAVQQPRKVRNKVKQIPQIQKFMTPMPHTIGKEIPLKAAIAMMREHRIRHLPVQDGGRLIGILTDRDVKLASGFIDAHNLKVEEVMTPDPYAARPEAPLNEVVSEMAEHKYGCVIVQQANGKVVGIFTDTDGMRVLGEMLAIHYAPRNG
jgi:acetoin utilization protein AcuB